MSSCHARFVGSERALGEGTSDPELSHTRAVQRVAIGTALLLLAVTNLSCRGSTLEEPSSGDKAQGGAAVGAESAGESPSPERRGSSAGPGTPVEGEVASAKPPGPPVDDVDKLPHLRGRSEAQVTEELGPPTSTGEQRMGECCSEFEVELYNTYPPNAGHDAVVIRRWDWDYEGYAVTVWFHLDGDGWVVLDTSRYSDDVEF